MKKYSIVLLVGVAIVIGGFVISPKPSNVSETMTPLQANSNEQGYAESNQDKW
jgi:hypothetical protein